MSPSPSMVASEGEFSKFTPLNPTVEEEQKMSHHSSSMNESDFDNLSSWSSVSSKAAEMLGKAKDIQRNDILGQIRSQVKAKNDQSHPRPQNIEPTPTSQVDNGSVAPHVVQSATIQKPVLPVGKSQNRETRGDGIKTGTLSQLDNYRKSDKRIVQLKEESKEKEETNSLDEDWFDNMSDTSSEESDSSDDDKMDRKEIENIIKQNINKDS